MAWSYVWKVSCEPILDEFAIDNFRPDPVATKYLGSLEGGAPTSERIEDYVAFPG
jgi:hypothetical protein